MNSGLLDLDDSQEKVVKDKVEHKKTRKVGDDVDVFEYGMAPRPNNPYFMAKSERQERMN